LREPDHVAGVENRERRDQYDAGHGTHWHIKAGRIDEALPLFLIN
jgi:hypothetical protein